MLTASGSCCQTSSEDCLNPCSFNATSKHHECTANGVSNAKCLLNGLPSELCSFYLFVNLCFVFGRVIRYNHRWSDLI